MASRRYFAYDDPYDYYYAAAPSPYDYSYPYYYYQQPAGRRAAGSRGATGFFPAADAHGLFPFPLAAERAEPAAARRAPAGDPKPRARPISIPVRGGGSDESDGSEPEERAPRPAGARAVPVGGTAAAAAAPVRRAPSAEAAAVRVQAAARGFLARRSVRAVREVEREAAEAAARVAREEGALRADPMARAGVGEALMRMLLRLDAVRGAREYRRKVTRRVLALQDAVDALEPRAAAPEADAAASEVAEEESPVASEVVMGAAEQSGEIDAADGTAAEMEVDGDRAGGETEEPERAQEGSANPDGEKPAGSDSEGEWEMVTEDAEPAAEVEAEADPAAEAASCPEAPTPQPPVGTAENRAAAEAANGGLDANKVMEMVAALCERSAQQCALIGALAERVDSLERAVRRVEDAERRRRRAKKLRKEGKGSNNNHSKCYSD